MILDSLAHCANYLPLHPLFPAAFDYLKKFDPCTPDGKHEIDGKRLFALVQRYDTVPEEAKAWEAHRLYADIQYIVSGRERILHAPVEELQSSLPYDAAKDLEKFRNTGVKTVSSGVIPAGSFGIYLPQDAHKPGVMVDGPEPVLKVVIKVLL